jgi:membrane protein DedA with SNARE-associated domain
MVDWVERVIESLGWVGVGVLVALENLFPPIPSEVVLPLAGYVAGGGGPSYVGYVIAATAGSVVGAWALYAIAAVFGQTRLHAFVNRYGRWFGVDEKEILRAEQWFDRRADVAVLVGRCVPLIRSLVSLPAGLRRMPLGRFTVLTAIGSTVWNAVLIGAGVVLEDQWERVGDVVGIFQLVVIGAILLLVALYARKRLYAWLDQRRSARRPPET